MFLTVMNGGLIFGGALALAIPADLEFDYVHATRYRGGTRGNELLWIKQPRLPMRGRIVSARRRYSRRRLHLAGDPRFLPRSGRTTRADRGAVREDSMIAPRRTSRADFVGVRSAGPLRVRFRHGLLRAGPKSAGHLRAGRMTMTLDLAVIGGTGLYAISRTGERGATDRRHAVRCTIGRDRAGEFRGASPRVSRAAWRGSHARAAPGQLSRQYLGTARISVRAASSASMRSAAFAPTWVRASSSCRIRSSTTRMAGSTVSAMSKAVKVEHIDFTEPYSANLRRDCWSLRQRAGIAVVAGGCYGATQGPRLETVRRSRACAAMAAIWSA